MSEITVTDGVSTSDEVSTPDPEPSTATAVEGEGEDDPGRGRRPASNIEGDLKAVCDKIVLGQITLPDGKLATPHFLSLEIQKLRGADDPVSTGAVTAAMKRWVEVGYISTNAKPFAFTDYTPAGRERGLNALKAERREARKAERAAAKAAKDEGAAAEAPTPAPAPEPEAPSTDTASDDVPF